MQGLNFIAIDFETATGKRASVCEAGICVVKDDEWTKPWPELRPSVSVVCADGDYQPSLGVLGVPLIMVPDRIYVA